MNKINEKCLECERLGTTCNGPAFMAMPIEEIVEWCNARRKQIAGMTYDHIADVTGLAKATVYRFFNGQNNDCRMETLRPILKLLVGGNWSNMPCDEITDSERNAYEERIRYLEKEIVWHEDKLHHFEALDAVHKQEKEHQESDHQQQRRFLMEQLDNAQAQLEAAARKGKSRRRTNVVLVMALIVLLLLIMTDLILYRIDPSVCLFDPHL